MEVITSLDNPKIVALKKLKDKKYRDQEKLFLVETYHLIKEADEKGILKEVLLLENETINIDAKITYVSKKVINELSFLKSNPKYIGVVEKYIPKHYKNRLLILDNIQDPGNLGTIIRSATAFNIDTIILSDNCVDLYNDKVIRASEGMLFKIDVIRRSLLPLIDELKENGYQLFGTDVVKGTILKDVEFKEKIGIIIGNEGKGISKEIKEKIESNIYIPTSVKTESLNASVAASIIMYEMSKKDYE